jgi:hypothetical protein
MDEKYELRTMEDNRLCGSATEGKNASLTMDCRILVPS